MQYRMVNMTMEKVKMSNTSCRGDHRNSAGKYCRTSVNSMVMMSTMMACPCRISAHGSQRWSHATPNWTSMLLLVHRPCGSTQHNFKQQCSAVQCDAIPCCTWLLGLPWRMHQDTCRADLHAVEAHEVVQLGVADDVEVHEEEEDQWRPLALEVQAHKWPCTRGDVRPQSCCAKVVAALLMMHCIAVRRSGIAIALQIIGATHLNCCKSNWLCWTAQGGGRCVLPMTRMIRECGKASYMELRPKMSIQGIMKKAAAMTRMRMLGGRLLAAPSICPVSACRLTSCMRCHAELHAQARCTMLLVLRTCLCGLPGASVGLLRLGSSACTHALMLAHRLRELTALVVAYQVPGIWV